MAFGKYRYRGTNHINPSPSCGWIWIMLQRHNQRYDPNSKRTPNQYAKYGSANFRPRSSPSRLIQSPYCRNKLRQSQRAQHNSMCGKSQIVELHRWRKPLIPQRVLMAYLRRIEKGRIRNEVCQKAQNVDSRVIDGGSRRGASLEIQDRLRIEGGRPADSIDPAEELGKNFKE